MENFEGCQIPCVPKMSEGIIKNDTQPFVARLKRSLAKPWNYHVKIWLKRLDRKVSKIAGRSKSNEANPGMEMANISSEPLKAGDMVRVRSREEIAATLDRWKELRGCAMLEEMWQYCDTTQRVVKVMERFLDERDYKVKKVRGIVLLDNVFCSGTPVFGPCDRSCYFFWRVEWLEKIDSAPSSG